MREVNIFYSHVSRATFSIYNPERLGSMISPYLCSYFYLWYNHTSVVVELLSIIGLRLVNRDVMQLNIVIGPSTTTGVGLLWEQKWRPNLFSDWTAAVCLLSRITVKECKVVYDWSVDTHRDADTSISGPFTSWQRWVWSYPGQWSVSLIFKSWALMLFRQ